MLLAFEGTIQPSLHVLQYPVDGRALIDRPISAQSLIRVGLFRVGLGV